MLAYFWFALTTFSTLDGSVPMTDKNGELFFQILAKLAKY